MLPANQTDLLTNQLNLSLPLFRAQALNINTYIYLLLSKAQKHNAFLQIGRSHNHSHLSNFTGRFHPRSNTTVSVNPANPTVTPDIRQTRSACET